MGEYWKPVNFTKREFVHPHNLDCGLKLGEWNHNDSDVIMRVKNLISAGQWSEADDICACSDYGGRLQMYGSSGERPDLEGYEVDDHGFADVSTTPLREPKPTAASGRSRSMITITQAEQDLARIRANVRDSEHAHSLEDALHRAVLKAIAQGSPDSRELARIAVQTTELKFSRWKS